jgi:hypothetical protein
MGTQWSPTRVTCTAPAAPTPGTTPVTLLLASLLPATSDQTFPPPASQRPECPSFLRVDTGLNFTFTPTPPPALVSLEPRHGPAAGGTVVTLQGTGFVSSAGPPPRVALLARLGRASRTVEVPLAVTAVNSTVMTVIMVRLLCD